MLCGRDLTVWVPSKVSLCFLGTPLLLSRISPFSFLGVYTVHSRKPHLLLSSYVSSSLSRIISHLLSRSFPYAAQEFPPSFQEMGMCLLKIPLLFPGISLCFPGILPVLFLGILPPVFWEFSSCFLRNLPSKWEFSRGFADFLSVLCRNLTCAF